ncbi:type VII secretion target [Actinoplanes couchii]|uniref:ESX-1 secretion-associated protein n=1 Tax=Actinoplanes couchii TaxID=403638 RepID=A0ABQ3XFE6_9ACTN|nr:type VII secretion target [Actinoplanes couchii]MDR6321827.1 uncharacterized protein YukE [Actinoplanes couchii]GID57217.1 hypothetical protein Aco03nite_056210 [Actinoplanes couchii]
MADGYGVTPDELRRHAAHLDVIAGELDEIKQAGGAVVPAPDSYGRLCVVVPDLLGRLQAPLTAAIGAAGQSVRDTAGTVRGVADSYEAADEATAAAIRGG